MSNEDHAARLRQNVSDWNEWRRHNPSVIPDLSGAYLKDINLRGADLRGANLNRANLCRAHLKEADLTKAHLSWADLSAACLTGANLQHANLRWANMTEAKLVEASLRQADLTEANLKGANLKKAKLNEATLRRANLATADLRGSNLRKADLREAILDRAELQEANLSGASLQDASARETALEDADLENADLREADLSGADFSRAKLKGTRMHKTTLADVNLFGAKYIDECNHSGPSTIDHRTLMKSASLPIGFLRGVGLQENFIEYLPSLLSQPIEFYSCFISYSSRDQDFADRLYADLQSKGVRCWFAPHDLPIGAKIWDALDEAIRLRDKLLLILSERAIGSRWVADEVNKAFAEERDRNQIMLFPVRLDDSVLQTSEPWARKLRDQRNIGDFTGWKDHDAYRRSFERILRDLTVQQDL